MLDRVAGVVRAKTDPVEFLYRLEGVRGPCLSQLLLQSKLVDGSEKTIQITPRKAYHSLFAQDCFQLKLLTLSLCRLLQALAGKIITFNFNLTNLCGDPLAPALFNFESSLVSNTVSIGGQSIGTT